MIRMGNTVNLGNIAPASLAALETQRLGLRGDTFNGFIQAELVFFTLFSNFHGARDVI